MRKPEEPHNPPLAGPADGADSLPKSELNPLINPVLGQNLGRWADVYFTSPPEKREEAVEQLLRELKSGSANVDENNRPVESTPFKSMTEIRQQAFCPACQGVNQADERFCGYCGEPLMEEDQRDSPRERQVAARSTTSTGIADDELKWLRDKTLASFEQASGTRRRGLLYLAIGAVVLLATFGYLQWASLSQSKESPQVTARSSTNASVVKETHEASASKPERTATVPAQTRPAASAATETGVKRIETSTSRNLPTPSAAANANPIGPDEVAAAQDLLDGRNGVKDSARAAQLLWKAVGRQNPKAALTLAELYARGEGVPKSCDQARLLLIAAAKKGVPEASLRLRSLEADGCQ
jgi:hypothetical protein